MDHEPLGSERGRWPGNGSRVMAGGAHAREVDPKEKAQGR